MNTPNNEYTTTRKSLRRFDRIPVDFPVQLRWPGPRSADLALNFSEGGLCLSTALPLKPGTLVSLSFSVAGHNIDLLGRVVWSKVASMGVRFEVTDPRLETSAHYLRHVMTA